MISILIEGNILKIVVHVVRLQGLLTAVKLRIYIRDCCCLLLFVSLFYVLCKF